MDLSKELGPDAPVLTHTNGAKESLTPFSLDSTPAALLEVGRVLYSGEQTYGDQNWRGISSRRHLRHALNHILAHLTGDRSEGNIGHLTRAACRLLFAIEVEMAAASKRVEATGGRIRGRGHATAEVR